MNIRKATIQDKSEIIGLMNEFNDYYADEKIFPDEFIPLWEYKDKCKTFHEAAEEWLSNPEFLFFVAIEMGKIAGYICGQVKKRDVRILDKEGYIYDWFVSKEWREKGFGTALFSILVEEFSKKGCNRLGLLTNIHNKKTIDYYHSLGFIDDSINMVKKLE